MAITDQVRKVRKMSIAESIKDKKKQAYMKIITEVIQENMDCSISDVRLQLNDIGNEFVDIYDSLTWKNVVLSILEVASESSSELDDAISGAASEGEAEEEVVVEAKPRSRRGRPPKKAQDPKPKAAGKKRKKAPVRANPVNMRDNDQKEVFTQSIIKALKDNPQASLGVIHEEVGGTPAQIRSVLNHLRDQGDVVSEGSTRNTTYALA